MILAALGSEASPRLRLFITATEYAYMCRQCSSSPRRQHCPSTSWIKRFYVRTEDIPRQTRQAILRRRIVSLLAVAVSARGGPQCQHWVLEGSHGLLELMLYTIGLFCGPSSSKQARHGYYRMEWALSAVPGEQDCSRRLFEAGRTEATC